jgi:NADH-quinone oxidoreductase subunit N
VATKYPVVGVVMTIAMLSLIGIPPLAGFFGKFTIFRAAIGEGYIGLSVLALVTSAVSVGYYLRPMITMFMREELDASAPAPAPSMRLAFGMAVATFGVILLGILPDGSLEWAAASVLAAAN